ncbi:MAG: ABC transporter ATP-binding protein [Myxococcales bacterium]|nr:ABC transporter ATP-binding protein [Myxococcales bacterium]
MAENLLEVHDLQVHFRTDGGVVRAVDGVSFHLERGATLGIVGESGSGKSVTCNAIMGLIPTPPGRIAGGRVLFGGRDLVQASAREMRRLRGNEISMIFQDPMSSLNPYLKVSRQLTEVLELHQRLDRKAARKRGIEMLEHVGIPDPARRFDQYPHQFSGGMRQRVMIAMALLCKPRLLIADEPTTALDVTIQAQILELIKQLKEDEGTSVILITHDLGVVAGMADEIMVMYAGRVAESAPAADLFRRPAHPYTRGLLDSVPRLDADHDELKPIRGLPPIVTKLPPGCPFAPRCDFASDACRRDYPAAKTIGGEHFTHCHHPLQEVSA